MNNSEKNKIEADYLDAIFNKLLYELGVYIYKRHKKELKQNDYIYFTTILEYLNNGVDLATHEYFLLELRRVFGEENSNYCSDCIEDEEFSNEKCKVCRT